MPRPTTDAKASRSHPLFARLYVRVAAAAERVGAADHRSQLLRSLRGRVVEVGAGHGITFAAYPAGVSQVVAVEPEPYLRRLAAERAARLPLPITVVAGDATALPLDDASCDAAVVSLVLCSVGDQRAALAELRRVLRPGGELRFYEHVRADTPGRARLQDAVDLVWPRLAGGCHCNRDTVAAIAAAGFEVVAMRRFLFQPCFLAAPVAPHVLGCARRP